MFVCTRVLIERPLILILDTDTWTVQVVRTYSYIKYNNKLLFLRLTCNFSCYSIRFVSITMFSDRNMQADLNVAEVLCKLQELKDKG